MAVRPIRLFGDPILRTPADPVHDFDRQLRSLVRDLTETLRDAGGFVFIDRMDSTTRKAALRAIREADWSGLGPTPTVRVSPHPLDDRAR
jgi:peptide deformylase